MIVAAQLESCREGSTGTSQWVIELDSNGLFLWTDYDSLAEVGLADEHAGRAVVVAVTSVDAGNSPGKIRQTVRRMEREMRMRVAIDDGTRTSEAYRMAAREEGLPRTFVVDGRGRLAWIGHPADAEPVVASVVASVVSVASVVVVPPVVASPVVASPVVASPVALVEPLVCVVVAPGSVEPVLPTVVLVPSSVSEAPPAPHAAVRSTERGTIRALESARIREQ